MYKVNVTYENFNDERVSKDLYFNFTKAELLDLEKSENGGFFEKLKEAADNKDVEGIYKTLKIMALASYGKRTEDGDFIKNNDIKERFACSPEFSQFLDDIVSDNTGEKLSKFMSSIMPKEVREKINIQDVSAQANSIPDAIKPNWNK